MNVCWYTCDISIHSLLTTVVFIFYRCMTSYHKLSGLEEHTFMSFLGSGVWTWLSWALYTRLKELQSRCQVGCVLIQKLIWGRVHFQAHWCGCWSHPFPCSGRAEVPAACWLSAGGCPLALDVPTPPCHVPTLWAVLGMAACFFKASRRALTQPAEVESYIK